MANIRILSPAGTAPSFKDLQDAQAEILIAGGWVRVGTVGPTSARPPSSPAANYGYLQAQQNSIHFDTTLNKTVVFDGANWRDPLTGNVA